MAASQNRRKAPDADAEREDELQYGHGPFSRDELDEKYPARPHNHSKTFPFHDLFLNLFNPLNENKKRPAGPAIARKKQGRHGARNSNPAEEKRNIIQRFISRWRNDVGPDFYPAIRLIVPEKDRDRPMYGLKEKGIGKIICKMLNLTDRSEDGYNLLNWKLPGQTTATRMAGDFAGRCFEVLRKRQLRTMPGDLTIAEVNALLDKLAAASKEDEQLPIFEELYNKMNAEEMMWLIRIILRQMKVGASEKTLLNLWHADGEALFNVSSSLRRVCWELVDPEIRLEEEQSGIAIMSCFQPQLAQFQMHSFQKMVDKMHPTEEDPEFWIEEKLDGERMQMHMAEDKQVPGGWRFGWWSRKAKDYTYLYGNGYEDDNSAMTRHIRDAFDPSVRNLILDGEMITWDPEADIMVPFGTLKTAAISEQKNPFQGTQPRPLFRVFDILFLNDNPITRYQLRDRRKALEKCVRDVHRRLEIHQYEKAESAEQIEPALRKVVAEASEGLVLKNPRSLYRLNDRNDDWLKVKPEYMEEFGESLDCVIIGGYYGSGHRGGRLSSFLCGLVVDGSSRPKDAHPELCFSFFKVGGGFKAEDYAAITHKTEGRWHDWDRSRPPSEYIQLGGHSQNKQYEKPDVWIKPSDSVVVEVKAAQVGGSEQFRIGLTLRFPRFKRLREDKTWQTALTLQEFIKLKATVEAESKEKEFKVDNSRKRNATKRLKKEVQIVGNDKKITTAYAGQTTAVFSGLDFCVLSDMVQPIKKSKGELEQIIKSNGGAIWQGPSARENMIVIGNKNVVKVASLVKAGITNVVKGTWVLDCLRQAEIDVGKERFLVPFEPSHMFYVTHDAEGGIQSNADVYGDSYARDVGVEELKRIFKDMHPVQSAGYNGEEALADLEEPGCDLKQQTKGRLFRGCTVYITHSNDPHRQIVANELLFGGAEIEEDLEKETITQVVVVEDQERQSVSELRRKIAHSARRKLPRIVSRAWVDDSWNESTRLDEERYAVVV
ncbi:DNA ligase-3 [Coleophoma crateriformis]|uniref:DNA ligase n=1 Tax=Coleophoma crateriformis TaxID=565419 RepID=A0A3D8T8R7_9HELO|nr:DNA ligase-3 [Coleophoma crateriformis]